MVSLWRMLPILHFLNNRNSDFRFINEPSPAGKGHVDVTSFARIWRLIAILFAEIEQKIHESDSIRMHGVEPPAFIEVAGNGPHRWKAMAEEYVFAVAAAVGCTRLVTVEDHLSLEQANKFAEFCSGERRCRENLLAEVISLSFVDIARRR